MDPQPVAPQPTNNYDFILNPKKSSRLGFLSGGNFMAKIIFIIGGAIAVMVVTALAVNVLFGSKTSLDAIVSLAQTEQEIARLSAEGKDADAQQIKNSAANTEVTVTSHQQAWLAFLSKRGRVVKKDELNFKKNAASDKRLNLSRQAGTFDTTYVTLMRAELTDYAKALKNTYQGDSNKQERIMLNNSYKNVQLLLKQWP